MDYKRYDIVVIPPKEIAERAIEMSRALARLDSFFVIDGETIYPHISLYHVPLDESGLEAALSIVKYIAADTEPFLLKQETLYPEQGISVGVRYVADKAILDLHTRIIESVKNYRVVEDDARYKARWAELSPQQRKHIEDCGWKEAFTSYFPHITFTKLKQPRAGVLEYLPKHDFSFFADHIGIYELGDNGTCTYLIATFMLEKKN